MPDGRRLWQELLTTWRFAVVGVAATAVHALGAWVLIDQLGLNPYLANLFAFLIAFLVSFSGQYWWTFRSDRHWRSAVVRFFIVAVSGYALSNLALLGFLGIPSLRPANAAVLAVLIIPPFTYLAGRFWAFR